MRFKEIKQIILLALSLTVIIVAISCMGADTTKPPKLKGKVVEIISGSDRKTNVTLTETIDLTTTMWRVQGRAITDIVEVKDSNGNLITVTDVLRNNSGGIYQINLPAGTTGSGAIKYKYTDKQATSPITETVELNTWVTGSYPNYIHIVYVDKAKGSFNHVINYAYYMGSSVVATSLGNTATNFSFMFPHNEPAVDSVLATVNYTYDKLDRVFAPSLVENVDYIVVTTFGDTFNYEGIDYKVNTSTVKFTTPTDYAGKTCIIDCNINGKDVVRVGIVQAPTSGESILPIVGNDGFKEPTINKVYVY